MSTGLQRGFAGAVCRELVAIHGRTNYLYMLLIIHREGEHQERHKDNSP